MKLLGAVVAIALAAATVGAQSGPAAPGFEVASVKPNNSGDPGTVFDLPGGGRFTATNATARELVRIAFEVQDHKLIGLPEWTKNARFDISARAAQNIALTGDPSRPTPVFAMLRSLLAERFQLTARSDVREMPIYQLVMARSDRRLGPRLNPSTTDCAAMLAARRERARNGETGSAPSDRVRCGSRSRQGYLAGGAVQLDGGENSLAMALSRVTGRTVIDRTGLTGLFDYTLEFAPDATGSTTAGDAGPVDSSLPSLTTALREQLGLKIESAKGPMEVVVIDRIERPAPD
jgi:uncharacterized protein (TIGR03435 family)